MGDVKLGNLYSMNKEAMKNETPINKHQIKKTLEEIEKWAAKKGDEYFMMLSAEQRYYTVFELDRTDIVSFGHFKYELLNCMEACGRILSIDYQEDTDDYEIWIIEDGNDPCLYRLFPYDWGVIKC